MRTILFFLLNILVACSAWGQNNGTGPRDIVPENALNTAAVYLDTLFTNTADAMGLIALTPDARQNDWEKIKPYLKQMASDLPGVYFFALPNGNYYTLDRDFTNLNLANREYFPALLRGERVIGSPVYSRSSGKKSAVVAVPVVVEGNVTGMLGISIFLDELYRRLERQFSLPEQYMWFAIDSRGTTMLDRESELIFTDVQKEKSRSLQSGISQALMHEHGTIQYESGGKTRYAYYQKLPRMDWRMVLARSDEGKTKVPPPLLLSLDRFVPNLQKRLNYIDHSTAIQIAMNRVNTKNQKDFRKLLNAVLDDNPEVVEASFVCCRGYLRYIEPQDYKNYENTNIGTQEHVIEMRRNKVPIFSKAFTAVEGFLAVDIAHPLYNERKQFIGSLSVLLRPELLVDSMIKKCTIPDDYELWIMQTDGTLIYDQDKDEIGRNLFTDPLYAEYESLLELGKKVASTPEGEGSYFFLAPGSKEKVIKNVIWKTVKLHNQEWRVALAYRPYLH